MTAARKPSAFVAEFMSHFGPQSKPAPAKSAMFRDIDQLAVFLSHVTRPVARHERRHP